MSNDNPAADPHTTGRQIVTFTDGSTDEQREEALRAISGIDSVASTGGIGPMDADALANSDAVVFSRIGVGVAALPAVHTADLVADPAVVTVEPERVVRALPIPAVAPVGHYADTANSTWGLQATGADTSSADGRGIRIAVLDTGFDQDHPDFGGRTVIARSFVVGESTQDGHGHGTHCVGTSSGPRHPTDTRRYGVAPAVDIFVGKVLSNRGSGNDSQILAGIEWAISQGCAVISMSLGADIDQQLQAYEEVGRRALDAGTVIVAAAGNNAHRPDDPGFVGSPANATTILAVGAVASDMTVAPFSARSSRLDGGQVDITAPGVNVYSSWPAPRQYNTISGTSMATPHVAGIAALWAQQTGERGRQLWARLLRQAQRLDLPAGDVGAGLARAPE
ncbi:S8 family serine peptidase [Williamsia sterculiae]|uniref:Subtilase family protein n=1 Tax=Williamsia sterculiae TaxID=1344003 RepID=A0A1N7FIJ5_9NOCA|nr:S8 family serine peptidase [Williamsia sterculiae]SIS00169.1 Subtilase family protein [Williamsia sterculiae]